MSIGLRIIVGAVVMAVGFWMVAVMAPPDPGVWSFAALSLLVCGVIAAVVAALDLMDDRR